MNRTSYSIAATVAALIASHGVQADVPANSAYNTDPVNEYVQDDTSQGTGNLNTVLCVIGGMSAGDMVNTGPYIALIDMNKCNGKGSGSSSTVAGATNYATAVVNVTRASNADPMIGKLWLSMTEDGGGTTNVFAYLSATTSPSSAAPYGVFRMDYLGTKDGQPGFNGFVDAKPASISQYETGPNSSNSAMTLTASSTSAGSGTIAIIGGAQFDFAFNAANFRRRDGTNDLCFDRAKANAQRSVWQYGTYNASDGSRVDMAHPGFPIQASYGGSSYYGFANYWGINFQGLDLNTIPDAQPIANLSITDQRPKNASTYSLSKVSGKLTKWTQVPTTLNSLDGIPFTVGGIDLTGMTTPAVTPPSGNNWQWQLQWSSANQVFTVIGTQQCGNNGCAVSALTSAAIVNADAFNNTPLSGWADSYGGNINIASTTAPHVATDVVDYYLQSTVIPGSAALSLQCLNQCPTAAALQAFQAGNAQSSPFGNGTDQQWFSAPALINTVSYSFGTGGLEDISGATPVPMVVAKATQYPANSPYAQNGINTGRLFDASTTPLVQANCPSNMQSGTTVCEPANPASYYTWQTGSQQWDQSLWLTSGANVVPFDPQQNIQYTVPAGTAYGSYAGLPILLQFDGFGNLNGIPGYCVDPINNATVDCGTAGQNARYVPMFSLPDGTTMTLNSSTTLIVKALNAELRLKNLGASGSSACVSMPLTPVTPPSAGTHDPSSSADSEYLGVKPTVSSAPKVIDGVVQ
jgi:hypothetical protein